MSFILRIHGEDFTVDHEHETEAAAEAHAYKLMSKGVRSGNRIYPVTNIVFAEILERETKI